MTQRGTSSTAELLIGYGSAIGAVLMYDVSSSFVQALQGAVPDFQLAVVRSVVQLVLYKIGARLVSADLSIKRESISGLLYLGAAYSTINVGLFGAVAYLPLTEVVGVATIAMMIAALLHSRLLFNGDISKSNIVAITVCIMGIMLTVQPSWLFKHVALDFNMTSTSTTNVSKTSQSLNISGCSEDFVSTGAIALGYVLSIIGGAGSGVTYDICGIMLKGVKPIVQAIYGAAFSTVGSLALMFYMEDPVFSININQLMLVLGHAVTSACNTFFTLQSAKYIAGPSLSIVYSFDLVTILIFQYTVMHTIMPGNYNWIEVLGCFIIVFGASIPAILDILAHRAKADELP